MTLLDRYLLNRIMWPLLATVMIALAAMLLERMVRLLDLVVAKGGPILFVLRMLANLIPHYLGLALPIAFFIGILMAISRLSADSELDAMNATGVSLYRLLAPVMVIAVILVGCGSVIFGFLQPYTRYAYRALVFIVTETAWESALERGSFFSGFGNFTIMANDISDGGRQLNGIFLHEERPNGGSTTTTAEVGRVFRSTDDLGLILRLENGVRVDAGLISKEATVLSFDSLTIPLDASMGPKAFRVRGNTHAELTLPELFQALRNPPEGTNYDQAITAIHSRIVRAASFVFLPLIAMPLGMTVRRSRRSVSLGVGIVILLLYHYLIEMAAGFAASGSISPYLAFWVPFALFTGFGLWCFHVTATRPGANPFNRVLSAIDGLIGRLVSSDRPARAAA
jgi:lipopolysaccharide export system permease protein